MFKSAVANGTQWVSRGRRGPAVLAELENFVCRQSRLGTLHRRVWICSACRAKQSRSCPGSRITLDPTQRWTRSISASVRILQAEGKPDFLKAQASNSGSVSNALSAGEDASLPSQTEKQRWQLSKRMARVMDSILARASVAGHHINAYTGTDYSGIEALRKQIGEQESKVKDDYIKVEEARSTHRDVHVQQTSAQKEIVGLLERKSSWSPQDLERYMSLVRSEHTNEQKVQNAKEGLSAAERALEEARSLLERLERKQYHEEQIWSDTIRRNSTWVTFVLMGVNILLLLAQISVFEPYRRRKIVRDMQIALDQRTVESASVAIHRGTDTTMGNHDTSIAKLENLDSGSTDRVFDVSLKPIEEDTESPTRVVDEVLPEDAAHVTAPESQAYQQSTRRFSTLWSSSAAKIRDLFSERVIQIKKIEMTSTVMQGAATGAAMTCLVLYLLHG